PAVRTRPTEEEVLLARAFEESRGRREGEDLEHRRNSAPFQESARDGGRLETPDVDEVEVAVREGVAHAVLGGGIREEGPEPSRDEAEQVGDEILVRGRPLRKEDDLRADARGSVRFEPPFRGQKEDADLPPPPPAEQAAMRDHAVREGEDLAVS